MTHSPPSPSSRLPRASLTWLGLGLAAASGCLSATDDLDSSQTQATQATQAAQTLTAAATATATAAITDDAYVASQFPDDVHNTEPYLVIGTASPNLHHIYLKLAVSGIPAGATHITATLQLTPQTSAANVLDAHCGTSNAWSESTITWNNQLGFSAPIVSTLSS